MDRQERMGRNWRVMEWRGRIGMASRGREGTGGVGLDWAVLDWIEQERSGWDRQELVGE